MAPFQLSGTSDVESNCVKTKDNVTQR